MKTAPAWQAPPDAPMSQLPLGPRNWMTAPDPALRGLCASVASSQLAWHCCRPNGHGGRHAAYLANGTGETRVVAVWSDES